MLVTDPRSHLAVHRQSTRIPPWRDSASGRTREMGAILGMVEGIGQERGHQRIVRRVGDVKRPSDRGAQNFYVVFNRRIHGSFGYKADSKRPSSPLANRSKINPCCFSSEFQADGSNALPAILMRNGGSSAPDRSQHAAPTEQSYTQRVADPIGTTPPRHRGWRPPPALR